MTDLLARSSRRDSAGGSGALTPALPVVAAGALAALWSAALGLLGLSVLTLLAWAAAGAHPEPGAGGALRLAGLTWLSGHHGGIALPGGHLGLPPLGLTLALAGIAWAGGGWTARAAGAQTPSVAGWASLAYALPYACLATLLGWLTGRPGAQPVLAQCFAGGALLAAVAGGLGALRAAGVRASRSDRVPRTVRALALASAGALATLVGAGALLAGGGLTAHLPRALDLADALRAGPVGGFALLLVGLAYLPNVVIWGAAYAVGTGFAVGAGTIVAPGGVSLGAVPAVPLLAALPESGPAPVASLLGLLAPVAAGVVAGLLLHRRLAPSEVRVPNAGEQSRDSWWDLARLAAWGLGAGASTGMALGLLAALSGGPLATGRLATVGPSGWQVGVAAAFEVGVVAALSLAIARRHGGERSPTAPEAEPGAG